MRRLDPGPDLDDPLGPYRDAERHPSHDRPWVLANMVCGLDGSTAIEGRVGQLSGPTDRQLFVDLRSVADVVLVGAGTARQERYRPVRLSERRQQERRARGRSPLPRLAIVSRSLELDGISDDLYDEQGMIVITCEASPDDARRRLAARAEVIVAGSEQVDLPTALGALRQHGVGVVLCEGGPTLLGALLAAEAVDELCLTLAPVVGGDPLPVAVVPSTAPVGRARLDHVLSADDDLFLRYLFR